MTVNRATQDFVCLVNNIVDRPTAFPPPVVDVTTSATAQSAFPWANILNGHAAVPGRSLLNPSGLGDTNIWFDTIKGGFDVVDFNGCGLVNLTWRWTLDDTFEVSAGIEATLRTTSTLGNDGVDNLFSIGGDEDRIHPASAIGSTWMLQLADLEHEAPEGTANAQYYRLRIAGITHPSQDLQLVSIGEVYFGDIWHPPCPSYPVRMRPRPGVRVSKTERGYRWERSTGPPVTEIALVWNGITQLEQIELHQFALAVGDPWNTIAFPTGIAGRRGYMDLGAPFIMSMHNDAHSANSVALRSGRYVVLDPNSYRVVENFADNWDVAMTFLEVA